MKNNWKGIFLKKFISDYATVNLFFFDYNFFRHKKKRKFSKKFFKFLYEFQEDLWFVSFKAIKNKQHWDCVCERHVNRKNFKNIFAFFFRYWNYGEPYLDYNICEKKLSVSESLDRLVIENGLSKIFFSKIDSVGLLPFSIKFNKLKKETGTMEKTLNFRLFQCLSKYGVLGPINFYKKFLTKKNNNYNFQARKNNTLSKMMKFLSN